MALPGRRRSGEPDASRATMLVKRTPRGLHGDRTGVSPARKLADEPPQRDVLFDTVQLPSLRARELERAIAVVVGQARERRVDDVTGNATLLQRHGDRGTPLTLAIDGDMDQVLGERRIVEVATATRMVDDRRSETVVEFVSREERAGLRSLRRSCFSAASRASSASA